MWVDFDAWYTAAYADDLTRENAGEFDATRAMVEELPEVRYKVAA